MVPRVERIPNRSDPATPTGLWRPLLDGVSRERALGTVRAIADAPGNAPFMQGAGVHSVSLAGGTLGTAVLHAYLGRAGIAPDDGTAERLVGPAISDAAASPLDPSLYGGLTGLGWAVEHLRESLTETDPDEICGEVDESLGELLLRSPRAGEYDLVSGLVGFGVYAMERLPRPVAVANLERVVDHLAATAVEMPQGLTWWTDPALLLPETRERCPHGYYDLGVAHGIAGVIGLLGQTCAAGVAVEKARPLLDGAVRWLLARQPADGAGFTHWIDPDSRVRPKPARLAWCYGDPGIACALLGAARCVDERDWEREALAVAHRAAACPPEQAAARDVGLCHGAAGLGHLFNRMFQATGDAVLGEAARFWFRRTLELRHPSRGIAGFAASFPEREGDDRWVDDPGILTGAAGIALALLSAATSVEPEWDRMLLTAIPPRI